MATFLCLWGEEADLWVWQQQQAEEGKWEEQRHNHTSSLQLSSSPKMEKMSKKWTFLFDERNQKMFRKLDVCNQSIACL